MLLTNTIIFKSVLLISFCLYIYANQFLENEGIHPRDIFLDDAGNSLGKQIVLEDDPYLSDSNLEESILQRRTSNKANPKCEITYCDKYSISMVLSYDPVACNTTFCYLVSSKTWNSPISSFEIIGANYDPAKIKSNVSTWEFLSYGRLKNIDTVQDGTSKVYCFSVPGKVAAHKSVAFINSASYSCEKQVEVPGISVPCEDTCVLDMNFGNARCKGCESNCLSKKDLTVKGDQTCTLNVLTPAAATGPPCNSVVIRPCPTYCPVDCELGGPFWAPCPANCATPVAIMTGYYTPTCSAAYGGRPCSPNSSTTTKLCSLPPEKVVSSCPIDCVVDGKVSNVCSSICAKTSGNNIVTTYTYPITVSTASFGGRPCPTITTTCNCDACVLGPTPTLTQPCDAACSIFDGRNVCGNEYSIYPVATSGSPFLNCNSIKPRPCTKNCPCVYTASSCTEKCTITSTNKNVSPWLALGHQTWTATGTLAACQGTQQVECSTKIDPVDCIVATECPSCDCSVTNGPAFYNTDTKTCTLRTLTLPLYGGKPCPTATPTFTCNNWCPGCDYGSPECDCFYTHSMVNAAGSFVLAGTKTCERALIQTQECQVANFPDPRYSCKPTLSVGYPTSMCSTTVDPEACVYQLSSCVNLPCTYTSTSSSTLPWMQMGTKVCQATGVSPGNKLSCASKSSTVTCSGTLRPIDFDGFLMCDDCSPTCGPNDSDVKTASASCSYVTKRSSRFGGKGANPTPPATTCFRSCTPKSTNTPTPSTSEKKSSVFGDGAAFNAVIYANLKGIGSSTGGSLAVGGAAELRSYKVGEKLSFPVRRCSDAPSLLVAGSIIMFGEVMNGPIFAGGPCDGTIQTECQKNCLLGGQVISNMLDFISHRQYMIRMSQNLANRPATSSWYPVSSGSNSYGILWNGGIQEIILMSGSNVLSSPNEITGTLGPSATVIINVDLTDPVFPATFSFNSFQPFKERLIWNFPKATTITIQVPRFVGTIVAPNAAVLSSGSIEGQIFALYLRNLEAEVYPELKNNLYAGGTFYSEK